MAEYNLFPEGYEAETVNASDLMVESEIGYRNGIEYNYEIGDFVRNGQNQIVDSTGLQSWESWCKNCLLTQRFEYLAYSTDFGIDYISAMRAGTRAEAESMLIREITEALMADPYGRTEYIEDILFDWTAPDAVSVQARVHGKNDVTIDITAYLTKGEI